MSFATLEEAWGLSSFATPGAPAAPRRHQAAKPAAAPRRKHGFGGFGPGGVPGGARGGSFAPAPELTPQRADDDVEIQNAKKLLARTYARYGTAGLARLLPREAVGELAGGGGRGGAGWWDEVVKFVSCPEKMLFVLLCAFALLVVWDSWKTDHAAHAAATLASMHMAPFPQGGVGSI